MAISGTVLLEVSSIYVYIITYIYIYIYICGLCKGYGREYRCKEIAYDTIAPFFPPEMSVVFTVVSPRLLKWDHKVVLYLGKQKK